MVKVLLGVTGSVAAIKLPELLAALKKQDHEVRVVATRGAQPFLQPETDGNAMEDENVMGDEDEWRQWRQKGDPVLHIEVKIPLLIKLATTVG